MTILIIAGAIAIGLLAYMWRAQTLDDRRIMDPRDRFPELEHWKADDRLRIGRDDAFFVRLEHDNGGTIWFCYADDPHEVMSIRLYTERRLPRNLSLEERTN